jgi:hypothetical protein
VNGDHEEARRRDRSERHSAHLGRIALVSVSSGEIACLVTHTDRAFEILWHAFSAADSRPMLVQAGGPRL